MPSRESTARRADEFGDQQRDGRESGVETSTGSITTDQSTTDDPLRAEWAGIVAEFDRNREAFAAYVADVRRRVERDHGWTGGTDHMRDFIRHGHFLTPEGAPFRVNHNSTGVWCREVCRRWPDVAPHILPTLRASKFDRFYTRSIFSDEYAAALRIENRRRAAEGRA